MLWLEHVVSGTVVSFANSKKWEMSWIQTLLLAMLQGALQRDPEASVGEDPLPSQLEELALSGRRVALFYR